MKTYRLENFTRGWLIGDFEPSIIRNKEFEFMVRHYTNGNKEDKHVHTQVTEITVIISGVYQMNGKRYYKGDIIHLEPGEETDFLCVESGCTAVIKTPSIPEDKFII